MRGLLQATLPVALLLILVLHSTESLRCRPCNHCPEEAPTCINGHVLDICYCCMVCGKGEGEVCGGPWDMRGKCGDGLVCVKPQDFQDPEQALTAEGKCQSTKKTKRSLVRKDNDPKFWPIRTPLDRDWHLDLEKPETFRDWVKRELEK